MAQGMLAPEVLEEISQFFRLRDGVLVDDLCLLVQTRLRQRLEAQQQHLAMS